MTKKDISKHKTTTTRGSAKQPRVFDIMPRGRVRASATSRPVITNTKPIVSDNTLASASALGLKRRTILPFGTSTVIENAEATEAADVTASNLPQEKGVSVADLLAKQTEQQSEVEPSAADETPGKDTDDVETETTTKNEANALTAETPGKDSIEADVKDSAKNEAKDEKSPSPNIDDDESLAKALQGDGTAKPQEHSEALKEAMKDLDDKDNSKEGDDGRPHYDLYEGKPVIVVHKGRGAMSAMVWVLWFFICVIVAVAIVDVLLDAGIVETSYKVPYTDFIKD